MASLALPLGPLLRSMPPLQAYAFDIVGSMLGIAGVHAPVRAGHAADRLVRRRGGPASLLLAARAPGSTPWSARRRRSAIVLVIVALIVAARPSRRDLVAVLPDQHLHRAATASCTSTSTASRTRRSAPGRRGQGATFYDQLYKWFPDRTFDRRPDRRRRLRHRRRDRAGAAAPGTSTRSRSTRRSSSSGIDHHPDHAVPGPARHPPRQRRPGVPARHRQAVRPGHLRPARLADARQHDREHPARVVPVHRAGVRVASATTSRRTACSCSTTTTASRG